MGKSHEEDRATSKVWGLEFTPHPPTLKSTSGSQCRQSFSGNYPWRAKVGSAEAGMFVNKLPCVSFLSFIPFLFLSSSRVKCWFSYCLESWLQKSLARGISPFAFKPLPVSHVTWLLTPGFIPCPISPVSLDFTILCFWKLCFLETQAWLWWAVTIQPWPDLWASCWGSGQSRNGDKRSDRLHVDGFSVSITVLSLTFQSTWRSSF